MTPLFAQKSDFITSLFTREAGYTEIESNNRYSRKQAIEILNAYTPQGASPQVSLRIGSVNDMIGIGYYYMENISNARLSTVLSNFSDDKSYKYVSLPTSDDEITDYISNNLFFTGIENPKMDILQEFDTNAISIAIYSILAGDNVIIIHPDHEMRLRFFGEILSIFPMILLKYNRLTTNCKELDGNENIIGVPKLPNKYRSHEKLHLPLDTIFIDLVKYQVTGGGVKNNEFTKKIAHAIGNNEDPRMEITDYIKLAISYGSDYKQRISNFHLVQNIRVNLEIEQQLDQNWLMSF